MNESAPNMEELRDAIVKNYLDQLSQFPLATSPPEGTPVGGPGDDSSELMQNLKAWSTAKASNVSNAVANRALYALLNYAHSYG